MVHKEKFMVRKIVVVSPHPDDETLGAGGTILKYKDLGAKVYWINVTNMKGIYGFTNDKVKKRKEEIKKVLGKYAFDGFFDLGLKPAGLDQHPAGLVIEKINKIFAGIKPELVILPYKSDIHSDHRITFESAYACTKVFRNPYIKRIFMMEIVSETDIAASHESFSPNCFVDISGYLDKKVEIMKVYASEGGPHPFPRSEENIRALAITRGSQAGCRHAEAFMVLKEIW